MKNFNKHITVLLITLVAFILTIQSCDDDNHALRDQPRSRLMVVNLAIDFPAVDVLFDDSVLVDQIAFPGHTDYLTVPSGRHTLAVRVSMAPEIDPFITEPVEMIDGLNYTFFVNANIRDTSALLTTDLLVRPDSSGYLDMRFVNLAPDVVLEIFDPIGDSLCADEFQQVSYKECTDFVTVYTADNTVHIFEIRDSQSDQVLCRDTLRQLKAERMYTLYTRGFPAGTGEEEFDLEVIENL